MAHRIVVTWDDPAEEGSATEAVLRATDELEAMTEGMTITVTQELFYDDAESV